MSSVPTQKILVIDEEEEFREWTFKHLKADSVQLLEEKNPHTALDSVNKNKPDLIFVGPSLGETKHLEILTELRHNDPDAIVILSTMFPSTNEVIDAMRLGAHDFIASESLNYELRGVVEAALVAKEQIRTTNEEDTVSALHESHLNDAIIGKSAPMQTVFKMIGRVSRSEAPVLITGESGSGKELVASAIHKFSPRKSNEFIAINCAAIPENLLESELFGHEKGAFTGAVSKRPGRFEQCDGGTLFLDEIGDMPSPTQSKILRVLQDGTFSRIGSNETLYTDVRIVAATNRKLEEDVSLGNFREDLFYRLNVVRIHLPPLRERKDDIPILSEYFLKKISEKTRKPILKLSEEATQILSQHDWPGNVRELENTLQRAAALANSEVLLPQDIPLGAVQPSTSSADLRSTLDTLVEHAVHMNMEENEGEKFLPTLEKSLAKVALEHCQGDEDNCAQLLGVTKTALSKLLK